jgi:hypothetical protein
LPLKPKTQKLLFKNVMFDIMFYMSKSNRRACKMQAKLLWVKQCAALHCRNGREAEVQNESKQNQEKKFMLLQR